MAQKKNKQTRIHRHYYLVCLTEQGYQRYTGVFAHRADAVARADIQSRFGGLTTTWNDINDLKYGLIEQLNDLNI